MTVAAQELEVFHAVVGAVAIDVIQLKRDWLSLPFTKKTPFANALLKPVLD